MNDEKTEYIVQVSRNHQRSWIDEDYYKPALNFKQGVMNVRDARKEERECGYVDPAQHRLICRKTKVYSI